MMTDNDFLKKVENQEELSEEAQQHAGKPVAGTIGDDEKSFAETVTKMIDSGEISPVDPQTFLNHEIYDALDEEWKDTTDLALVNIGNQLQLIHDFMKDPGFTNDSPQLQTMVEQLWQMKQKIEEHHDVFKF